MARLWTAGGETQSALAEGITSGTPSFSTATKRSGAASFDTETSGALTTTFAGATGTTYFARTYLFKTGNSGVANDIGLAIRTSGGTFIAGILTNNGESTLDLVWGAGLTVVGTSAALSDSTWYSLEISVLINAGSTDAVEARINGVSFASASGLAITDTAPGSVQFGNSSWTTSFNDDLALNDSSGASQNSWPGSAKVVLLNPSTDSAVGSGWTLGTGTAIAGNSGATAIKNKPALGVADLAAGSDTKQIRNASSSTADYDTGIDSYTTAGVASGDTINVVVPFIITGAPSATGAKSGNLVLVSNPAGATDSHGNYRGSANAGTFPTGWKCTYGTPQYAPSVTLGTSPVLRADITSGTATRVAMVCEMGMYVDYTPSETAPFLPKLEVTLVDEPTAATKEARRGTSPHLFPPAVVGAAPAFYGPQVSLADPLGPNYVNRRVPRPQYIGPHVIPGPAAQLGGTLVQYVRTPRTTTKPFLRAPVLTPATAFVASPIRVELAAASRPTPKSVLRKPTDTVGLEDQGKVATHLAYSRRGKPSSRLEPPAVVGPVLARPTATHLSYSSRGKPKPRLAPPAVVAPILARPVEMFFADSFHGTPKSALHAPAVVATSGVFRPLDVELAYSVRGTAKPRLGQPTVVAPVLARAVETRLAASFRGNPKSRLAPPAVVGPVLARAIETVFARIRPRRTTTMLRRPTDTVGLEDQGRVTEHLAYSRRGTPKSDLRAPVVVDTFRVPTVTVWLAYSKRGTPKSVLGGPTDLVDQQDLGRVQVHLAPSRSGRPTFFLTPPQDVFPFLPRATDVTLARIRPARTIARLEPPTDTQGLEDQGTISTSLAYSLRGRPKSVLRKPVVIDLTPQVYKVRLTLVRIRPVHTVARIVPPSVIRFAPPVKTTTDTTLVRITPAPVHSKLRKPVVVGPVLARPVDVTFAPQRRGLPKSKLRLPTVIDLRPQVKVISVTLAYSRRGTAKSSERQVPVVGQPPETVFLSVTLAASRRGHARSFLIPPAVVTPFVPPTTGELRPGRRKKLESIYDMSEEEAAMIAAILADL